MRANRSSRSAFDPIHPVFRSRCRSQWIKTCAAGAPLLPHAPWVALSIATAPALPSAMVCSAIRCVKHRGSPEPFRPACDGSARGPARRRSRERASHTESSDYCAASRAHRQRRGPPPREPLPPRSSFGSRVHVPEHQLAWAAFSHFRMLSLSAANSCSTLEPNSGSSRSNKAAFKSARSSAPSLDSA